MTAANPPPQNPAHEETAQLYVDGCSAREISEKLNTPIRTVYDWLAREDVQARITAEIDFRERTRRRLLIKHYAAMYDFAADVVTGKQKVETEAQERLLNAFLGINEPPVRTTQPAALEAPAAASPMLPAGPLNVHFHNHAQGDGEIIDVPARPTVIRSDDDA